MQRRRLYGGLSVTVFFLLFFGGFHFADSRNAGGFWAGLAQLGDFPAGVLSEAWAKRALLPGQVGTVGVGCPVGAGNFANAYVGAPVGGTTIQIAQTNAPVTSIGANYFSLDIDVVGAPLPVAGCTVYLPLAQPLIPGNVFVTSGAGAASSPFNVPAGFPGFLVNCQAAVITPNALGFVLSNSALMLLQ